MHFPRGASDYNNTADVFVLPSRMESFGIVLLEALACGTPVVASSVGGIKCVVQGGVNGLLVPYGDVEGLAEGMLMLLRDRELASQLVAEGPRRIAERYGWMAVARQTLDLYEEAASQVGEWREVAIVWLALL